MQGNDEDINPPIITRGRRTSLQVRKESKEGRGREQFGLRRGLNEVWEANPTKSWSSKTSKIAHHLGTHRSEGKTGKINAKRRLANVPQRREGNAGKRSLKKLAPRGQTWPNKQIEKSSEPGQTGNHSIEPHQQTRDVSIKNVASRLKPLFWAAPGETHVGPGTIKARNFQKVKGGRGATQGEGEERYLSG